MVLDEHTIKLPDGRALEVWLGGEPVGRPVVVHHGTPMAGLLYEPNARDTAEHL